MSAPYATARPESWTIESALSALADAMRAHIDNRGVRDVSVDVGVGKSTVHEWGGDMDRWTVAKFVRVAASDPVLWDALMGARRVATADSTDAERLAFRGNAEDAAAIIERGAALVDGRWDANEARRRVARIDEEIAHRIEEKAALMARMGRQS